MKILLDNQVDTSSRGKKALLSCLSAQRVRVLVAAMIALAGVAVAWQAIASQRSGRSHKTTTHTDVRTSLEQLGVTPESIRPIPEEFFRPLDTPEDVRDAMAEFENELIRTASDTEGLSSLSIEAQRAFAHTAAVTIAPFLTGDLDQYIENVKLLGGKPPATELDRNALHFQWEHNNEKMSFVSAAPSQSKTILVKTKQGEERAAQADFSAMFRMGMTSPGYKSSGASSRFPAVADWRSKNHGLDAYEARVPVRLLMKKNGAIRLGMVGVVFAQSPDTGEWQPVEIRHYYDRGDLPKPHTVEEARALEPYTAGTLHM